MAAAEKIEKAAFTRADLVKIVGAQLPLDTERTPRELVETAVDAVAALASWLAAQPARSMPATR
jgi:hypothetical protein